MESSSSEDDFVVPSLLEREKIKRKYWVSPILRYREFSLLIKELRDYPGRFKVYFRMSVNVDALLALLEPYTGASQ